MPSIQQEATSLLSGIPFNALIGGPMNAAVDAQVRSAKSTADFIQSVAFHPDTQETRHVSFVFEQAGRKTKLQVPLLAIVPVPFLRIEELNINFKACISSETSSRDTSSSSEDIAAGGKGSASVGWGPFSANIEFSASYSSKKDSSSTRESKYSVQYTIDISCRAVQDDMPAGLAEVLAILRENIKSDPIGLIEVDTSANAQLELTLPDASQGQVQGQELPIDFIARNSDGVEMGGVMVEFACESPDVVVMIPRARTGADGKVQTRVKYIGAGIDNTAGNLASGAMVSSFRVGAKASSSVGSADVDLKVA